MSAHSRLEAELSQRIGTRIADLRIARSLTQEGLAQQSGLSTNHIQLLESGLSDRKKSSPANPRLTTLVALSRVLGVSVTDLLPDSGSLDSESPNQT